MNQLTFGWIDYFVFIGLLGSSFIIGLYFAFFSKQNTINEYLYAGKSMTYIPVAISTVSSMVSAVTFLGRPTEIYLHGSQYFIEPIGLIAAIFVTNIVFLPVHFKLQLLCITEYLELRFSKSVRRLCSFAYLVSLLGFSIIVIYAPALAFSQLTGLHLYVVTPIVTSICIFYTSLGGVKAVIWTDAFQFIFTLGGTISVLVIGISSVGGFSNIWQTSQEGGRLIFFKAVYLITFLKSIVLLMCILLGLTMYTKYHGCDPKLADVRNTTRGPDASVLCDGRSATLNTLGSVIYDDFLRKWLPEKYNEESKAANIIKILIVIVGIISTSLIFLAERLGTIFKLTISFMSTITGPVLGLFILGVVLPWVGKKGALVGGYSSLICMIGMMAGTKWHYFNGKIHYENLPTSTDDCPSLINKTFTLTTTTMKPLLSDEEPMILFRISILYYSFLGATIVIVLGLLTRLITRETNLNEINPDHITPIMHRFLPKTDYIEVPLEILNSNEIVRQNENSEIELN